MCADADLSLLGIRFLQSPRAQEALSALASEPLEAGGHLQTVMKLRERFSAQESGWLMDQAVLRRKAAGKFLHPERCLLLDEALQQASSLVMAEYHARQFMGFEHVADLGCGIGGDLMALANWVPRMTAVEIDPIRAALSRFNATANGFGARVTVLEGDWTALPLSADAAFIDPARRIEGRRVFSLHSMIPPLSAILQLSQRIPNLAVKAAPGVNHDEIPDGVEVEFISEQGEMKEALLRFGSLKRGRVRCATLLPARTQFFTLDEKDPDLPVGEALTYLYEPDPSILRARLVKPLGEHLDAAMIDPEIAYLTSNDRWQTPFARVWKVIRQGGFHLKTLNQWLREAEVGEVVIKKRGSPIDPDEFQKRLKTLPEGRKVTVFFTQCLGRPWMILAQEA